MIGAGSSGIATAKALHARGLPFVCYEASDRVGGNWVYQNKNGMSACYRGLTINTSKRRMEYSDFPMPDAYPDFPGHALIADYFEHYVDHFGFREQIRFETKVRRVEKLGARYRVTLDDDTSEVFDAVAVANGHHWSPRWPRPPFEGRFSGEQMHSHAYLEPEPFAGKRVVVVGIGNSAMDIAVEISEVAERTVLSSRRGAWVLPKMLFGRPADTLPLSPRLPFELRRTAVDWILRLTVGHPSAYGLPAPDHRLGEAHPTISSRILERMKNEDIAYRPNIARLDGGEVVFVDGSREQADVIIYCTGYDVRFPFFDDAFLRAEENDLPLFFRLFHPHHRGLFFIGLLQPLGAIMPIAEAQSDWIADALEGRYALPDAAEMARVMSEERERMFKRYVSSARHTMQVDFDDYLLDVARERRRGARRASRRGFVSVVGDSRRSP